MYSDISQWVVRIPVLLFAVTVHEYAHGRAALKMGDTTARDMGRLSLNPLPHIDPIGAICLFLFNFGWAKPVPINPRNFKDIRKGTVITSLAGPGANFLAALCAGILIRSSALPWDVFRLALIYMVVMNVGLGLFNLIPIPPLDGSHVLENLLSPSAAQEYRKFGRHGVFILFGIILLDNFAHTGIFSFILYGPMRFLVHLFSGLSL